MSQTSSSSIYHPQLRAAAGTRTAIVAVLAVWFVLVLTLGTEGGFATPSGTPPLPILIAVATPLALFLAALRLSPRFRELAMTADLRVLVSIQAWRTGGLGFLSLYAHGVLPGYFAFPAGLGDIAIGVTAPLMLLALLRRPDFAASKRFHRWNLLGILDLIVALTLGALGSMLAAGVPGAGSTRILALMPEVIIPAYLVPLFLILHLVSLLQVRGARGST